jgi:uncharacterized membrane protein YhaH (DUF805 family)
MSQPQMPGMPYAPAPQPQVFETPIDQPWYGINFGKAIERFFKKYVVFSGRASKSEFWWAMLFLILVNMAFSLLSNLTNSNGFIGFLSSAWSIAVLIPTISIGVRRLHDTNKPGLLLLLPYGLIVVGMIIAIVGGIGTFFFGLASVGGNRSAAAAAGSGVIAILFAVLLILAGFIVYVVLMCMSTDPAGARFDRAQVPAMNPMAPAAPMNAQQMQQQYPTQQPYAQAEQQQAQPYTPQTSQQPAEQQQAYPQAPSTDNTYTSNPGQPYEAPAQYPDAPESQQGQSGQAAQPNQPEQGFNPPFEGPRQ